ncbi:MAG: class I SAM-dependent methyltransferase [Parcubacteria group bacterium]|nr:class I SAM-dependent methyltransferase [Parcubacteria group bacterium]
MQSFTKDDYEVLKKCPWCDSYSFKDWGREVKNFKSVECAACGLIYVQNRLNKTGLAKHYENYLSIVHQANEEANQKRELMYQLEFDLINSHCKKGKVLDVGCSGGYFLNHFEKNGYECYGVEAGQEAAKEASKKFKIYFGDFADLKIDIKFDLIIFRGVIEHILYPKKYLQQAVNLLNEGGCIYITSTPNSQSLCCGLFEEMWNQHEPEGHLMHFRAQHFDNFFASSKFDKIVEHYFYEKTPYSDVQNDIVKVSEAILRNRETLPIDHKSPAFYGNMMSLVYKKCCEAE